MHVVLMVLAFIWWWPVGLALLAFVLARRRGYFSRVAYAAGEDAMMWDKGPRRWERKLARAQEKVERARERFEMRAGGRGWFSPVANVGGSGNAAFDEYRAETLRRLEEEAHEFKDFLGRLRFAKDRAEFDQFMSERRNRPAEPGPNPEPPAPQA